MPLPSEYTYESNKTLTKYLLTLLALRMLTELISAGCHLSVCHYLILITQATTEAQITGYVAPMGLLEKISWYLNKPLSLAGIILFFKWLDQTSKNAHSLSVKVKMPYSPGWSSGWFFVPIANFFMPIKVLSAIWNHSSPDEQHEGSQKIIGIVLIWWVLEITFYIGKRFVIMVPFKTTGHTIFDRSYNAHFGTALLFPFLLVALVLWFKIVKNIQNMQRLKHSDPTMFSTACPHCGEPKRDDSSHCPLCGELRD